MVRVGDAIHNHLMPCPSRVTSRFVAREVLSTSRSRTAQLERLRRVHGYQGIMVAAEWQGLVQTTGKASMAIGNMVQRGGFVYVYDEKGRQLSATPAR